MVTLVEAIKWKLGALKSQNEEFNGLKVPSKGDIIWKLKTGDYHWYHFEVKEIEYNELARY